VKVAKRRRAAAIERVWLAPWRSGGRHISSSASEMLRATFRGNNRRCALMRSPRCASQPPGARNVSPHERQALALLTQSARQTQSWRSRAWARARARTRARSWERARTRIGEGAPRRLSCASAAQRGV
jgi:hypothetical protein